MVAGESSHINSIIIINKKDLDEEGEIEYWKSLYSSLGYTVVATSKITNEGIDELRNLIRGNKNLFWGQSGVGKSSLINLLFPALNLAIGKISASTNKGIHTTVTSLLTKIDNETFIIDTPGIREIDPYGIKKEDLGHYFVEFKDYLSNCRFNTCTHEHEPGCAIIQVVEDELITIERYDSYLKILDTIEEDLFF